MYDTQIANTFASKVIFVQVSLNTVISSDHVDLVKKYGWSYQKRGRDSDGPTTSIRWLSSKSLSIYYTSASAYAQLSSKTIHFLRLPHVNTLKKYAQFTTAGSGFNPDIIKRLIEEAKVETLKPFQRNVVLSYDEMQIESQLVYKKSTGQMIGFT